MTAMDNKTQIDAILLDFAKAFDKVPHLRLLSKLISYGITGNTKQRESQLTVPCRTSQMSHLFADDSIIYRKISSKTDHEILQTDLSQLRQMANGI